MLKEAKVVQIGNSRGIRLPKAMILRAGLGDDVILEETAEGIMIRPKNNEQKLSWDETFKAMAQEAEDWSEWTELDVEYAD